MLARADYVSPALSCLQNGVTVMRDSYAAWAWLILTIIITLYVVAFDVWAAVTRHRLMTDQFRLWLGDSVIGPFIFGAWVAVFAGLTYHWFLKKHG